MQLARRFFVKENAAMARLCRLQTPVYNLAIFYLRQEYFHLHDDNLQGVTFRIYGTFDPATGEVDKSTAGEVTFEEKSTAGFLTNFDLNDKAMLRWRDEYRAAIPSCAAGTIKRACDAWKGYWKALKAWREDPAPFTGRPRMPRAVESDHRSPVYFTYADFSIQDGCIVFPKATGFDPLPVQSFPDQRRGDSAAMVKQVRVIPAPHDGYWVEIVHDISIKPADVDPNRIIGIDLGLERIATIVDNVGGQPVAIPGGPAKSWNHWYNKKLAELKKEQAGHDPRIAELQQKLQLSEKGGANPRLTDEEWEEWRARTRNTAAMKRLTQDRNNRIAAYYHRVSRVIVNMAVERRCGTIIIGHNPGQKQGMDLGRKTNQNFSQMPIFKLIDQIAYKARLAGIVVERITEEFTSKASFLDNDPLPDRARTRKKRDGHSDVRFSGRRVKRGLYKSKDGTLIHADVNGAYNIVRKARPNAFPDAPPGAQGIRGCRLHPMIRVIPAS